MAAAPAPQVVSVSPNATPAVPVPAPAPIAPAAAPISTPPQTAALPPAPLPAPPAQSGRGFIWPLKGEVILEYGTTGHGQHNDGINIAAARGTPVLAAESGVVAYAGNELRGFGNLLLIKHEGGWMTAYAHNDTLLVKRGDVVKRGQKIAKVGDSGGVSQPQLHFEVRQGTRAVDPATVLGGSSIPASAPLDPPDPG
jgi:murein DD-endopeptidase MepM/ murein hydrolase activator NlpD